MIRFYNGSVLVFDPDARLTSDEVWTDGARIVYVGPARDEMPEFDRQIDLKGDILMPGFKDAHAHTPMTFLRSYAEDLPLDRWLSEAIWPAEAKLTDEAAYDFTKLGIMEYLTSGITASFDMYMHKEHVVRANTDVGFRTVLCCDMNDFDKDVEVVERDFLRYNGLSDLVSFKLGMHAE